MTKPITRTSEGLRDVFNEIEELQQRNGDPRRALAVSNVARQIINTVRVELEYARAQDAWHSGIREKQ
jgi:hypothetical protein